MVSASSTHSAAINYSCQGISTRLNELGRLDERDRYIGEKVDPCLVMRKDVFQPSCLLKEKERQIDDQVRHKPADDPMPYGVKEMRFIRQAKAEAFALKAQAKLAPLLESGVGQPQIEAEMPSDVINVPVYQPYANPKVVTIVKTNRFDDARRLLSETNPNLSVHVLEDEAPPKKPSLLSRIGKLFKSKKPVEASVNRNREPSPARNDFFDRDEFLNRLATPDWMTYGI